MPELLADGTKVISLARAQFAALETTLTHVQQKLRCPAIFLADMSGVPIVHQSQMSGQQIPLLASLAAADYAATVAMAQLLGEEDGFLVHFHEGAVNSIYTSGVDENHVLTVIFAKNTTFGMVRVLAQRAVQEIKTILAQTELSDESSSAPATTDLTQNDFQDELSSRLDAALCGKLNTEV